MPDVASASLVPLTDYDMFGGRHWETAGLANMLEHAGLVAPHTRRPLSEAMCLGIAGGISAGYAQATRHAGRDAGSGASAVGRFSAHSNGPDFQSGFLKRIGARVRIRETTGRRAAFGNLMEALTADRPAVVWCPPPPELGRPGWAGTLGTYTLVVHGVDRGRRVAMVGDCAASSIPFSLARLATLRARVRSHRNRVLSFQPPKRLTATSLRAATLQGIRACAAHLLRPRLRTYGLPGLLEWSRLIANPEKRTGWPRLYRGGRLYTALRDTFDSIETAGTGGGLYRRMYAEFLAEAATLTGRKALRGCAREYRDLADEWSDLGRMLLPADIAGFRRTRQLLRQRARDVTGSGRTLISNVARTRAALQAVEGAMLRRFPLDRDDTMDLLTRLAERILELHAAEEAAARRLMAAAR